MSETPSKNDCREQRRYRVFYLPHAELIRIFQGRVRVDGVSLPKDAWVGNVHYCFVRDAFVVAVFSSEYEPLELWQQAPEGGSGEGCLLRFYQYPPDDEDGVPAA